MGASLRVLIVEDSLADAELTLAELRFGGYDPDYERVDTPEKMKAALEKREWDIILSDYVMPRFSGPAALKLFQTTGLDVPFIMVTGQVGEETAIDAVKAGANDYVLKGNLVRLVPAIQREVRDAEVRRERKHAEEARRKSEQLYRGLYQALGAGVVMQDAGGHIVEANETAQRILGLSLDQMRGLTSMDPRWAAIREDGSPFPGEEHPITIARLTGQEVHDVVSGVIHADGSRRWMLASAAPILASDTGKPAGAVATFVDITERKQMEEELRKAHDEMEMRVQERTEELEVANEELLNEIEERKRVEEEHERLLKELQFDEARWRTLVESIPELVTICDAEGRATYVNLAQSRLFGYQVEPDLALEEHPVHYQICHPDGTLFAHEDLPLQRAALHGEEARDVEIVLRTADGEERTTEWDAAPLRDAEGRTVGAVAIGRDVTGRKRTEVEREELLKEVEERRSLLQMVVKNAPNGIAVLHGHDLVYEVVNPAYQAFAPGKQMEGRTFAEVWPEAAEVQVPLLRKVLDTGEPFHAADLLIPIRRSLDAPLEDRYWTYAYLRLPPNHTGQPGILSWVTETTEYVMARQRV